MKNSENENAPAGAEKGRKGGGESSGPQQGCDETLPLPHLPPVPETLETPPEINEEIRSLWASTVDDSESPGQTIKSLPPGIGAETVPLDVDDAVGVSRPTQPSMRLTRMTLRETAAEAETSGDDGLPQLDLQSKIGEGGMGIIYRAQQQSLAREVAVKRIKGEAAKNPQAVRLFLSEAHVTGILQHPNIVPIYELGVDSAGRVFYTMKLVKGRPWRSFLHPENGTEDEAGKKTGDIHDNLEILLKVSEAVALAHSKGIVHRDLKPENVMVGEFGEVLVLDWGLAVAAVDSGVEAGGLVAESAQFHGPCGTPQYMAPEMARGRPEKIGPPTDVYLLGAILYEIIYGRPPHRGNTIWIVLASAGDNRVEYPEEASGGAEPYRLVLEKTIKKAMATETEDRYSDAAAFAEALRENLRHFDSIVSAETARDLLFKLDKTRPTEMSPEQSREIYARYSEAVAGLKQSLTSWPENDRARLLLKAGYARYAEYALDRGDLALAEAQLNSAESVQAVRKPDEIQLGDSADFIVAAAGDGIVSLRKRLEVTKAEQARRLRWIRFLQRTASALLFTLLTVGMVAFFWIKHEKNVAGRERDRALEALKKARWEDYVNKVRLAQAAYDRADMAGMIRALKSAPKKYRNWEWGRLHALTHIPVRNLGGASSPLWLVSCRPRSTQAAGGCWDGTVIVWDTNSSRVLREIHAHKDKLTALEYSTDGRFLATGGKDGFVKLWNADSGKEVLERSWKGMGRVSGIAFSADGLKMTAAWLGGAACVWEIPSGTEERRREFNYRDARGRKHRRRLTSIACSPVIPEIVFGDAYGQLLRWKPEEDSVTVFPDRHPRTVLAVKFSPNGSRIYTSSIDGTAGIWDAAAGKRLTAMYGHMREVLDIAVSPDGRLLATASYDNTLRLWDAETGAPVQVLKGHSWPPTAVDFSLSSSRLVSAGSYENLAKVWNLERGEYIETIAGGEWPAHTKVFHIQSSKYTGKLAVLTSDLKKHTLRVLETAGGGRGFEESWSAKLSGKSPRYFDLESGMILAGGTREDTVEIYNQDDGKVLAAVDAGENISALALNRSGTEFAVGTKTGVVSVFSVKGARRLARFIEAGEDISALDFQPDGMRLATAGKTGDISIYDLAANGQPLILKGHRDIVSDLSYSPDGKYLASASYDRTARIWDAGTGRLIGVAEGHSDWVHSVTFSPDGTRLLTGGDDNTARVWAVPSSKQLIVLSGKFDRVYTAIFSPDGKRVILGGYDGKVRECLADKW